jgi:hypothetical protein
MKYMKIFRILGIALVLSLLMLAIPATPALAASITLSPTSGEVGTTITVNGSGFTAGHLIDIYFGNSLKAYATASPIGAISNITFTVPSVATGVHQVRAFDFDLQQWLATADFLVTSGGEITIDPDEGLVGTEVEISGEGFGSREDIKVEYDGDEVDIQSGDEDTDSDGDFEDTVIIIPASTAGDHTITVIGDDSDIEAEAEFTVEPQITISPESGPAGTEVTIDGTGFGRRADITIYFNNEEMTITSGDNDTDNDGSFSTTFSVPALGAGTYDVEVEDEDDNTEEAEFTIAIITEASLNQTTGNIGTKLTVSGSGFTAGGAITIKYDDIAVATAVADSSGAFSVNFDTPPSTHGDHTITASDGTTTKQFTFTMESQAPSIPPPLLPEMGVKVEQPVHFDWEDVTDDSLPVTYALQVATDENFTTASIVLEEKELNISEYTIAEDKKLEPVSQEAPYYWRVRATDGASNESGWTTPGSFYTGLAFGMPNWAIYALSVFGGLLLLFIGFWLGRRTALY